MKVKISGELALYIASFESNRNWELEIDNAPRKKKKQLKKELSKVIVKMIEEKANEIIESANKIE
jgi:hypothetical protein